MVRRVLDMPHGALMSRPRALTTNRPAAIVSRQTIQSVWSISRLRHGGYVATPAPANITSQIRALRMGCQPGAASSTLENF